jgi:peroxiredoxin
MGIRRKFMVDKCFKAGEKAPDFELLDQDGKIFKLSDFKGKRVLLSFHPLAWTGVCTQQMKALEEHFKDFEELNTIAVGINVDSIPSKKAWAENIGLNNTRILSDFWPHGKIAKLYQIFREEGGTSERANIIINEEQVIEFVRIYKIPELPDIDEILTFLRNMDEEKLD